MERLDFKLFLVKFWQMKEVALAGIGAGGKGSSDIAGARDAGAEVVGLCDVDAAMIKSGCQKISWLQRVYRLPKII